MKALDEAEARLGCTLPKAFRETYATKRVLTSIADWELFEPRAFQRTRSAAYRDARERRWDVPLDAVIVGHADAAPLFMRFRDDERALTDELWTWEDQATAPTRVAESLAGLLGDNRDALERAADALLGETDGAAQVEGTTFDVTCPFCASIDTITVDPSGGARQTFVEDCASCCHPRTVHVEPASDRGDVHVWVERG